MLFQWYVHGRHHPSFHRTLFSYISLLALPFSLFLLCHLSATLFRRRRPRNDDVSLPPTQQNEEGETAFSCSSMVSSSEDDGNHGTGAGDSGSNQKREFVICAVCASRLIVSGSNRTWVPAAAIEEGRLKREQGGFMVFESNFVASSGGNGKTGEEAAIVDDGGGLRRKGKEFVVCTSSLVDQSGRDETEENKAAIDEGTSRKKVEFIISTSTAAPAGLRDGKSSSPDIIDENESSSKQEIVIRTSKSTVQNCDIGTGDAITNDQESIPNEETAVDEFFSCVSGMVPIVTGGSESGPTIDLVRLSIGEVEEEEEEEEELGSCAKLLRAIDDDELQEEKEK
ncbi:unnamed protein product [Linum trigynum]|uniref:Uncharacterized protein n=1 Tax=Linum trigynum TaxID=586398 RepID=A0AAV2C935_9ROSI